VYPEAKTPAARFIAVQAALLHGSPEQKKWGQRELTKLDRATLPWLFLAQYDEVQQGLET
jgi:hypothetical protein